MFFIGLAQGTVIDNKIFRNTKIPVSSDLKGLNFGTKCSNCSSWGIYHLAKFD